MTTSNLKFEIQDLKNTNLYTEILDFSNFIATKGWDVNQVNKSFKSEATYVDFTKETEDESFWVTVRFANHAARGNYGTTDFTYGNHLTIEENYETVEEILNDY